MTSAFVCSRVSCMTPPIRGEGSEGRIILRRGGGERHAHEREGESESIPLGCGGAHMCLLPFVCCVMNAPQITTLQQSFRMTEEKEMRGYGCWFFLLNICCFSCYLCCSVFISLHCHFRWCSSSCCSSHTLIWLVWVFFMTRTLERAHQIIISYPPLM